MEDRKKLQMKMNSVGKGKARLREKSVEKDLCLLINSEELMLILTISIILAHFFSSLRANVRRNADIFCHFFLQRKFKV